MSDIVILTVSELSRYSHLDTDFLTQHLQQNIKIFG